MANYLSQITNGAQIMGPDGLMYTIGQNPGGSYNLSHPDSSPQRNNVLAYVGANPDQINSYFNTGNTNVFDQNNRPAFGIGNYTVPDMGNQQLSVGFEQAHPNMVMSNGQYITPSSKMLGNNIPGLVNTLGKIGFGLTAAALTAGALGPAVAGADAVGEFSGGLGLGQFAQAAIPGAFSGGATAFGSGKSPFLPAITGGLGAGLTSYASNALSSAFPETSSALSSLNPFSSSNASSAADINWNPEPGYGPNLPTGSAGGGFSPSASSLSGGAAAPGNLASPSASANFGPSAFGSPTSPFSSTDPLSTLSGPGVVPSSTSIPNSQGLNLSGNMGADNISGAASPSIFDNLANGNFSDAASGIGNYAMHNPLPTALGIAGIAGAANQAGLFGSGNSLSSDSGSSSSLLTPPFNPSEQSQAQMPGSLSQYSGLDPFQQATNIATQGVYGRGNGPQENNYFLNLMNRQLFDQSGKLANDNSSINPIENSYLSQLGITGQNPTDILKGISQYGT